jgi:hypothetical protein
VSYCCADKTHATAEMNTNREIKINCIVFMCYEPIYDLLNI